MPDEQPSTNPRYIGDGVYIQHHSTSGSLIITTGSHYLHEAETCVILEPKVLAAFLTYVTEFTKKQPVSDDKVPD